MSSIKFIKEFETQEASKFMEYYSYSYYKELILLIFEYLSLIAFIFYIPVSIY